MNQFGDGRWIESKTLFGNHRNKTGAGFEVRVVELSVALILFEVGRVGRRKECALVVVKPPAKLGRTRVFEVDDHVFVTVEADVIEKRARAVEQSRINKFSIMNAFAIETGKQGGG
jgi:hypothetical protein